MINKVKIENAAYDAARAVESIATQVKFTHNHGEVEIDTQDLETALIAVARETVKAMLDGAVTSLDEPDPDYLKISWHIDDVKQQDTTLTKSQARKVLVYLDDNRDASVGINWDVIDAAIIAVKDV